MHLLQDHPQTIEKFIPLLAEKLGVQNSSPEAAKTRMIDHLRQQGAGPTLVTAFENALQIEGKMILLDNAIINLSDSLSVRKEAISVLSSPLPMGLVSLALLKEVRRVSAELEKVESGLNQVAGSPLEINQTARQAEILGIRKLPEDLTGLDMQEIRSDAIDKVTDTITEEADSFSKLDKSCSGTKLPELKGKTFDEGVREAVTDLKTLSTWASTVSKGITSVEGYESAMKGLRKGGEYPPELERFRVKSSDTRAMGLGGGAKTDWVATARNINMMAALSNTLSQVQ